MADTPEGRVKKEIKKRLKAAGAWWFQPVQNGMGKPGLDFLPVICQGRHIVIEAKAPGEDLTDRQKITRKEIEAAGGRVMKIDGTDYSELEEWLNDKCNDRPGNSESPVRCGNPLCWCRNI